MELGQYLGGSLGYDGWEQLQDFERWAADYVAWKPSALSVDRTPVKHAIESICRIRVYHFYLPVFFYIEMQLAAHAAGRESQGLSPRPLVFGISAPQARDEPEWCISHWR